MLTLITVLLVGLDNFIVCAGLGTLNLPAKRQQILVGLFMLAEMGMPLVGYSLALGESGELAGWLEWLGPMVYVLVALLVTAGAVAGAKVLPLVQSSRLIYLLPLLLAMDNLLAGASASAGGIEGNVYVMGLISALACIGGLWLGKQVRSLATS